MSIYYPMRVCFFRTRRVAAWTTLIAFISMVVAENTLSSKFGTRSWSDPAARPTLFEWLLLWRNCSLLFALVTGLIALPRWQSWVGLALTIGYTYVLVSSYYLSRQTHL